MLPFRIPSCTAPRHAGRRLAWMRRWALAGALALLGSAAAAADWSREVLYFVLVDRFADGDPGNNQGVDRRNPGGWHGGDLKGLTQQLDELRELGVTALWINPVQLQQSKGMTAQGLGADWFMHEGFHGYWIQDFERLDPHFGDEADLKRLVDEAGRRGIKVLLDVVINHAGYASRYSERRTASGESWLRGGEGNCEVAPVTCAVGGLPDFRTEIPEVRNHLIDANLALARRSGVAGFRLDTYKHVSSEVWLEHRRRTREVMGPDFFLLAEMWGGTAQSLDGIFERDEVDAGFDFSFKGSCEAWVQGRGRSVAYAAYLRNRHQVRSGHLVAHYLSSHDEPMMLGNLQGDKQRFRLCAALQMTSLGLPVIYYGEEVGRGGHDWPFNRNDMPWGDRNILPGKGVARDEALRSFYKQLIGIRRAHPALTGGSYQMLTRGADRLLAFGRQDAAGADRVIVVANREDEALGAELELPAGWPGGAWRDLLDGNLAATAAVAGDAASSGASPSGAASSAAAPAGRRLTLQMSPKSVRILVPQQP